MQPTKLALLIALMFAASSTARAEPAPLPAFTPEKCYGVAAALQNDCQTATHSCAGEAKEARDPGSWIYVPAGTCTKIDGGRLKRS